MAASESCLRRGTSSNIHALPPPRNTGTELHAICRLPLTRSSRPGRTEDKLPMDPTACVLVTDCSSLALPRETTLLRCTLRPTLSGMLCPCSLRTRIVFGKANVWMLFEFIALRILQPALHFGRRCARAERTAWSWHPSRGYYARPVCRKARSRAMCCSCLGTDITACRSCMCIKGYSCMCY